MAEGEVDCGAVLAAEDEDVWNSSWTTENSASEADPDVECFGGPGPPPSDFGAVLLSDSELVVNSSCFVE